MADELTHLLTAKLTKTPQGLQEIQTRSLGLGALARRVLILVDGNRTGKELGGLCCGTDILSLLDELLKLDCVALVAGSASRSVESSTQAAGASGNWPICHRRRRGPPRMWKWRATS